MTSTPQKSSADHPLVWLLFGKNTGDNQQLISLGKALDLPYVIKRRYLNKQPHLWSWPGAATLRGIDLAKSDPLTPPWPDLVIGVGRSSVSVAHWIRKQSGGKTKLVHIGRPRARFSLFDLIITPPQYGLPAWRNVRHLAAPLIEWDEKTIAQQAEEWRPRIAHLPRPWIGVFIGGAISPFKLDEVEARRIAGLIDDLSRTTGGALLICTSPRTNSAAALALRDAITAPAYMHLFQPDQPNPYRAFLKLCDRALVTADSASMATEIMLAGKQVEFIELARQRRRKISPWRQPLKWLTYRRLQRDMEDKPISILDRFAEWLIAQGIAWPSRDIGRLHRAFIAQGFAIWHGGAAPVMTLPKGQASVPLSDVARQIRALLKLQPDPKDAA